MVSYVAVLFLVLISVVLGLPDASKAHPDPRQRTQKPDYYDRVGTWSNIYQPKCNGNKDDFCEHVDHYPVDVIRMILRQNNSFEAFFKYRSSYLEQNDSVEFPSKASNDHATGRIGSDYELEERVCDVQEQVIRPKVGTNKKGVKRYIINDGNTYQQYVKVEKCRNTSQSCELIDAHLPFNHQSLCKQKMMWHMMMAFDPVTKMMSMEEFMFPVACVCYLISDIIL